jgi:TP901-1 family phage major tail protein
MAKIQGGELLIYVGGEAVAAATSSSLDATRDMIDVSNKDTGDMREIVAGRGEWSMSSDNIVDFAVESGYTGYVALFDAWKNSTEVTVKMALKTAESGDPYFEGSAFVSAIPLTAPDNDSATFSATFEGNGDLERKST